MSKVLILTLRIFSDTGGIERVSRVAGKALHELCMENGSKLSICSMYDEQSEVDERYFPSETFTGFGIAKMKFIVSCVKRGIKSDIIILSHINLLVVGYLIKIISPKTKLMLMAHGIEMWEPFSFSRRKMLVKCDNLLCVSQYTKDRLLHLNLFNVEKLTVLNNCLDPFLQELPTMEKNAALLSRYNLSKNDKVLMTLTRLVTKEKYKGYDQVIQSIPALSKKYPNLKYLLVGNYDQNEKHRLDEMIQQLQLENEIIFTGFVPDEELAPHFSLADIYIMPSEKEGFGIVFIEAIFYGKPVIAGNKDGSTDALLNGKLGTLIDPHSNVQLEEAVNNIFENKKAFIPDRRLLMEHFSFEVYKKGWKEIVFSGN
jgi:glycosyltransferase involved in cell wall biosynthesis